MDARNFCVCIVGQYIPQDCHSQEVLDAVSLLWGNEAIRNQTLNRPRTTRYHVTESAKYMFENMGRFWKGDYKPNEADILHARLRTTGIVEKTVKVDHFTFKFVDMGGQKTERRKWIAFFSNVTAVIFTVAISEYNQSMFEDDTTNRLVDSLAVFDEVIHHTTHVSPAVFKQREKESKENQRISLTSSSPTLTSTPIKAQPIPASPIVINPAVPGNEMMKVGNRDPNVFQTFADTAFILFLNKVDLFKEKIHRVPFSDYFPDYKGSNSDGTQIGEFIKDMYLGRAKSRKRKVYVHFTCATDTANFRVVFNVCKDSIVQMNLVNAGLALID